MKIGYAIAGASSAGVFPDLNGTEMHTIVFKKQGTGFITLKETINDYASSGPSYSYTNYLLRKRFNPPTQSNFSETDKLKGYDVGEYIYSTSWNYLNKVTTIEYDQDGLNPMSQVVNYEYNNSAHLQPTGITTKNSKKETIVQQLKYPADMTGAVYTGMINQHNILPVIESSSTKDGALISSVLTEYSGWQSNGFYKPAIIKASKGTNAMEPKLAYFNYDIKGNPLEVSKANDIPISYLWNYKHTYPVAEVKNASFNDIAYTSFEGDDKGRWTWIADPEQILPGGITGEKSFSGTLTYTSNDAGKYIVTLWSQNTTATVNGNVGELLSTRNGWKLYRWIITNSTLVTVTGDNIDEVRLYPANARMTTYTYLPFTGLTSVCDDNNSIVYNTYDGFGRLSLVRDIDRNILKQYEYKYNQQIIPCPNTNVNWMETGIKMCVKAPNANYTGEEKKEEKDMNHCSPTYLQSRWISLGITGQCVPVPDCDGVADPSKRVVNGVCEKVDKTLISSYYDAGVYTCMFKYVWSDGFESHSFIVTGTVPCIIVIEI